MSALVTLRLLLPSRLPANLSISAFVPQIAVVEEGMPIWPASASSSRLSTLRLDVVLRPKSLSVVVFRQALELRQEFVHKISNLLVTGMTT